MTIPDAQTLMRPILVYLADGQAKSAKVVYANRCPLSSVCPTTSGRRCCQRSAKDQKYVRQRLHWSPHSHVASPDCSTVPRNVRSETGDQVWHPEAHRHSMLREFRRTSLFMSQGQGKQPVDATAKRPSGDDGAVTGSHRRAAEGGQPSRESQRELFVVAHRV